VLCDLLDRLPVERLARDDDVHDLRGEVEELPVVRLVPELGLEPEHRLARRGHRQDVTGHDHGAGVRLLDLASAADRLDEAAGRPRERALESRDRLADEPGLLVHLVRAERDLWVRRDPARLGLAAAHLLLVLLALLGEVHAEEPGADRGQEPGGAGGAEQVRDGVGHRHDVRPGLRLLRRQPERVDRVRADAEHRRDGGRAGEEPRRETGVVARELRRHVRGQEDRHADDGGEDRLRDAVLLDPTEELRPHAVAHREEEHQEEDRLDVR
jgi:hypothetical protein